ncbi:hypothetical protein [Amphibacillus jilinensis]|uniref:hypothetical protein n=1 Tax=Amphibacillus jilinensis TaxID=1216008 RepID=UPI0002E9CA00|nr:hypothetical protein [Amphibacillus jilinensis]
MTQDILKGTVDDEHQTTSEKTIRIAELLRQITCPSMGARLSFTLAISGQADNY